MITVLVFKTVTGVFIKVGSKLFQFLIPVIDKTIRIVHFILIAVTELQEMPPRQRFYIYQLHPVIIPVHIILYLLILNLLRIIFEVAGGGKALPVGR